MSDRELRKSTREASEKTNIRQEARQNAKQLKKNQVTSTADWFDKYSKKPPYLVFLQVLSGSSAKR